MTELPWIKSYPKGVRWNAELPTMPLQQILEDSAKNGPTSRRSSSWAGGSAIAS